jgi:hypothetical protein
MNEIDFQRIGITIPEIRIWIKVRLLWIDLCEQSLEDNACKNTILPQKKSLQLPP